MWFTALALWILNGGTMSEQPTVAPKPTVTGPALVPLAAPVDPRTIADVEADLVIARHVVALERAKYVRAWPSRIIDNLCDEQPTEVRQLNWLIEEWQAISTSA